MAPPVQHRNILHFNPGNMSPRELEATFVGNETFLEELVSHVQKKRRRPDQKHLCLTGPRGIGKTTLLILLERRLGGGSAGDAIQVVRFAEEERQILSPHSFLKRLRELRPGLFPSDLANSSVVSWTKALLEGLANRNQDLVLLLDNLDHLLEAMVKGKEKGKEGDKKKADLHGPDVEKLLLSPHVIVVGTSLRGEKHLRDYSPDYIKGLYDHFEFRRVPGVTNIAMQLRARAEYDGDDYILEQLDRPAVHQRIRAVERLAEDNPRLVLFIYEYLSLKPLSDTYDLVEKLLNDVTPLYQDVLNRLVDPRPIHRAVLDKLMEPEGIATASEIAHELDIDTNPARTALRALADLGLVQVAGKQALGSGRPSDLFCVTPLLFWLWYSWRKGDQSVKALARAYTALASPPEIVGIISASQATSLTHQTQDLSRDTQAGHTSLVLSTTQQAMEQASNDCVDLFSGFIPEAAEDALGRGDYITVDRACQEAFSKESDSRRRRILELCIAYCNWIRRRQGSENLLTLTDELLEAHENKHESQKLRTDVRLVKSRILTYRNRREEARKELERALSEARKYPRLEVEILIDLAWLDRFEDSLSKAKERLEKALQMARRQAGNRTLEARALRSLGDLSMQINDLKEAQEVFDESLRIYLEIGNRLRQASTLTSLGELYHRVNRLVDAEKVYDDALSIYRDIEDRLGEATTLRSLGELYLRINRIADAEKVYDDALSIYRDIEDRLGEANTLRSLGDLFCRVDRLADAEKVYDEALSIYREIGNRLGEANTLRSLGELYLLVDRLVDAEKVYTAALSIYREIGIRLGEAKTLRSLGELYHRVDRLADAEKVYEEALQIDREIGIRLGEANTLRSLGDLFCRVDRLADAEKVYDEALQIYQKIDDRLGEANTLMSLGSLYHRIDRLADAEKFYEEALEIYQEIDNRLGEANTCCYLGELYHRVARLADAVNAYNEALSIYREIGIRLGEANTLRSLGDLFCRVTRLADAEKVYNEAFSIYQEIGIRLGEANTLTALGHLYLLVERLADAEKVYDEALLIYRKIEDRLGEANTLFSLGELFRRVERLADAEKVYDEALSIYREIGNRLGEANTLKSLGDLFRRVARLADAEKVYGKALSIYRKIGDQQGEANTLQSVGNLLSEKGEHKYSVTELEKALNAHKSIEDSLGVGADLGYLGRAWLALHDHDKARSCLRQSQEVFQQTGTVWGLGLSWESLALVEAEAGCLTAAAAAAMEAARLFARIEDKDREASNRMLALSFSARALTREPGAVEEVLPRLLDMIGGLPDQVVADIIANELFLPLASRGRAGASEMAEVATVLRHEASLTLCRLLDVIDEAALQLGGAESSPKRPMIQQSVAAFLARAESLDLHSASVALQEGKIHQAVQKLDEALASKPDDANALAMLASAKLRMGKAEQALELIKGVPEKIRQTLAVSGALVLVYDELRLSKEFLQQLDDHRSRHGDDHNLEMALAESHASRSDWPAAAEHWQEALNRCASANDRPRIATRLIFALLLADRQKEVELYFNRYSENQFKDGERLLWMMVQCAALLLDGKMDSGKKLGLQVVDLWLSNPAEIQLPVNPAPLVQRLNDSLVGRDRYFFPLLLAVIAGKAEVRELLGTFFSSSMVQDTLEVMEKAGNNSLEGLRSGAIEQLGDVKRLTQLGAAEEAFFNGLAEAYSGLDDRSRRTAIGLVSQGLEASEPAVRKTALRCLGSLLPSLLGDELEQGFQVLMEFIRSEEQPRELRQAALKIGEIASDVWPGHVRQRFRSAAARLSDQIHNTPERT